MCPSTEHRERLLCVRGQSIVEATGYPWTEHCRGNCMSVDIALSMQLCVRGQSIVEATVCPWTGNCRG